MSDAIHNRALHLIAQARIEGLTESESAWLAAHTKDCDFCAEHARQTDRALRLMRASAIPVPANLVSRTQFRVRFRAQELQEREPKRRLLWLMCAMSWALGIASAPYVWQAFAWIGQHTGAPRLLLQFGFSLWWAIPTIVAAAVMMLENAKPSSAGGWTAGEK